MKYLKYCIYLLLTTMLTAACSDDYSEESGYKPSAQPCYLYVGQTNFSFPSYEAAGSDFNVMSSDMPWKFEGQDSWINLSPVSGNTDADVRLTVTENMSTDNGRTSIFKFVSTDEDFGFVTNMSVSQPAAEPYIRLSNRHVYLSASMATVTIDVEANVEWTVSENLMWVDAERNGSKLEITVYDNRNDIYGRNGRVYVSGGGVSVDIIVEQAAPNITCETSYIEVENTPSTVELKIKSDVWAWPRTSDSWIEVTPESGGGPGEFVLTVNIAANDNVDERTGYVYITSGPDSNIVIPVRQKGVYINTDVTSLSFAAKGESLSVNVSSNTSWKVTSCPDWITASPASGTGDARLTLTAADNPYTASRSGYVHLEQEGLNLDVTISVSQGGKTFEVNTEVLEFSDAAATKTVGIKTDGYWSAARSDDWIKLSPVSGTGDAELSVSVSENTYDDERIGLVTITMGDKTSEVAVRQTGKYFTVSDEVLQIGSTGGGVSISVATNDSWTAAFDGETAPDWLSLSATSGSGTAEITVTAADNPSVNSRSAALIVATPHGQSVRVIVSQAPRRLTVSASRVMLLSKGGTSVPVMVNTDGKYKIESEGDWFTVAAVEGGFTVTAGANPTDQNRTGNVIVSLTDLKEGSLKLIVPVVQTVSGATFLKTPYTPDSNWNFENGTLTLTLSGYGADEDWNQNVDAVLKVVMTGYTDDHNWNNTNYGAGTIGRTDFGEDKDHDKSHGTGGSVGRGDYGNDSDWNPQE